MQKTVFQTNHVSRIRVSKSLRTRQIQTEQNFKIHNIILPPYRYIMSMEH